MKRSMLLFALSIALAAGVIAVRAMAAEPEAQPNEEAAVKAVADAYLAAYNRGDAKALADLWSEKGDWITPAGQRAHGRAAIERELESLFAANQGGQLEMVESSVRFVTPDVAIDEGRVRVTRPGEDASESTYFAVVARQDGRWKVDSLRNTEIPPRPSSQLLRSAIWNGSSASGPTPAATRPFPRPLPGPRIRAS